MKKNKYKIMGITLISLVFIVILFIFGALFAFAVQGDGLFNVEYRTADGDIINPNEYGIFSTPMSMIGEDYGITDMRFTVNVKNTGSLPITATIDSLSPYQLDDSITESRTKTIIVDDTATWTTDWIKTEQFEGATPVFEVVMSATDTLGRDKIKSGSISLSIMPDPGLDFDVDIVDSDDTNPDTNPDETPSQCTNECNFFNQKCVGGNVYSCVLGSDNCMNLVLFESCGGNVCSIDRCLSSTTCAYQTFSLQSYPIEDLSDSCCTFDCTYSQTDCTAIRETGSGFEYETTVLKGQSRVEGNAYNCRIIKCI